VSALATSFIVLACVLAGAVLGMFLRSRLPGHQLSADAKDVVRLGTGLIGTIAALVLGLLIASAKNAFDTQSTQVQQLTSNIILLDRLLAAYGPEAADARKLLRGSIAALVERIWHPDASRSSTRTRFEASHESEEFVEKLQSLSPKNDAQRSLKDRAFENNDGSGKGTLAAVRAVGQFDTNSVSRRVGVLAHHHICKFQLVCRDQRSCRLVSLHFFPYQLPARFS
jgi:hypothetical protein